MLRLTPSKKTRPSQRTMRVNAFVSCLAGLEPFLARELEVTLSAKALWNPVDVPPQPVRTFTMDSGGALVRDVSAAELEQIKRRSGVTSHVVVRLLDEVPIRALGELERKAKGWPWRSWLAGLDRGAIR